MTTPKAQPPARQNGLRWSHVFQAAPILVAAIAVWVAISARAEDKAVDLASDVAAIQTTLTSINHRMLESNRRVAALEGVGILPEARERVSALEAQMHSVEVSLLRIEGRLDRLFRVNADRPSMLNQVETPADALDNSGG